MTFLEMVTEVRRALGNLPSTHVFYGDVPRWVNRALGKIIRLSVGPAGNMNLFRELEVTTWKGTTQANIAYLDLPTDMLVVHDIFSFDKLAVSVDLDTTRLVSYITPKQWELGKNTSETSDYPRQWTQIGKRVYFRPIPKTGKLTDLHFHGISEEPTLAADGSTPIIDEVWHDLIVTEACRIGALRMRRFDEADRYRKTLLEEISTTTDPRMLQEYTQAQVLELDDVLTQGDVY